MLEGQLAQARARLASLDRTIATQTARLARLRGEYRIALARLEERPGYLYMTDGPDVLSFIVGTSSFIDILDNLELLSGIGRQDKRIATQVREARNGVAEARRETRAARTEQARVEAFATSAASEQRGVVTRLVASRDALVVAQREKSATLASIEGDQSEIHEEIEDLEAQSASLAEQIRQAQQPSASGSAPGTPPVVPIGNGTLGWPCPARLSAASDAVAMHEGIDITCRDGNPGSRGGRGDRDLGRLARWVRQPRRDRPRRRSLDRLRAQLGVRVVGGPVGRALSGELVFGQHRQTRAARTSTSRSVWTASRWIRSATSER